MSEETHGGGGEFRRTEEQTRRRRDLHGLTARYPVDEFPCLFLIGTHTFAAALSRSVRSNGQVGLGKAGQASHAGLL